MSTMPSRRDILRLIGAGAAAAFARSLGATDERVPFPKGAVIRTVLKDLPPEALAGGATLPIVAGAGYYTQPFYPPEIARWDEDEIAQELVRQVKAEAIGAYGEIGTWDAMTPDERKVFRAVGKAHLATNLPIFTHTNMGKGALEQLDVLESAGVHPTRVAIGHLGGIADPDAHVQMEICKRGAFV